MSTASTSTTGKPSGPCDKASWQPASTEEKYCFGTVPP